MVSKLSATSNRDFTICFLCVSVFSVAKKENKLRKVFHLFQVSHPAWDINEFGHEDGTAIGIENEMFSLKLIWHKGSRKGYRSSLQTVLVSSLFSHTGCH